MWSRTCSWPQAKPLPGANRLIRHLHKHGVPFALASNSIRKHIEIKLSYQKGWKESFFVILGGDEVDHGKPSPDIFLEAAKRMGVDASRCLVIEDSLVGVAAAKAAGMHVVAVPSLPGQTERYAVATCVLHTLLEFQPDIWGLPAFDDWIQNALPIEPLCVRGLLCKGVPLDSVVLMDESAENDWSASLPNQLSGVFFGWAKLGTQGILKAVMSIQWDISSRGVKRLIKPHLVSETCKYTLGKQLLVMVIGYIRKLNGDAIEYDPETVTKDDENIACAVLDLPMFAEYKSDSCFVDQS
ncbi:hypothetical protein Taro_039041 [Colocasia esculenta]|uniref:riboflavin kinase n=1 Tax=Colocasia esculenta TaxID=4460 RepID=A0A843WUH6_COLES|nr:hypothetical protein [Colocasia esculenta]